MKPPLERQRDGGSVPVPVLSRQPQGAH
jgi:hypothetical protein